MTILIHPASSRSKQAVRACLTCVTLLAFASVTLAAPKPPDAVKPGGGKAGDKETDEQARRNVQAVYDRQSAALMRKDVNGFLALCTPDYKDVKMGNRVASAGMIRQTLPALLAKYPSLKMKATIQTFERSGSQAVATAIRHVEMMQHDQRTNKMVPWNSDTVTRDIWVKTDKGWLTKGTTEATFKKRKPAGK